MDAEVTFLVFLTVVCVLTLLRPLSKMLNNALFGRTSKFLWQIATILCVMLALGMMYIWPAFLNEADTMQQTFGSAIIVFVLLWPSAITYIFNMLNWQLSAKGPILYSTTLFATQVLPILALIWSIRQGYFDWNETSFYSDLAT